MRLGAAGCNDRRTILKNPVQFMGALYYPAVSLVEACHPGILA
jgi:hypothetical protein